MMSGSPWFVEECHPEEKICWRRLRHSKRSTRSCRMLQAATSPMVVGLTAGKCLEFYRGVGRGRNIFGKFYIMSAGKWGEVKPASAVVIYN